MMKRNRYTEIICSEFCRYSKEGREELMCGSYRFLTGILTPGELKSLCREISSAPDFSCDREIRETV
ncbi:MAG TPA: hypothetical protein VFG09_04880, partial [Thermodesulfovibrionales bacterium]|nr:hypothetical protein [Thermodesulfovibrionales bacterium]